MAPEATDFRLEYAVRAWTQRHSSEWTQQDELRLTLWLEADPENRAAYAKVASLWRTAGKLERSMGGVSKGERRISTAVRVMAVGGAVLTACLIFPAWRQLERWWNGTTVHWTAPRGEARNVVLGDGTRAILDADSELITKFGAHARRVALVRGEASFTVTHDVSRPFDIEIGTGHVVDLGTRFDVERLPGVVRVAVFEGRVGVKTSHGELVLDAGRASGYDDAGLLLAVGKADSATGVRSDGVRHFDNEPLAGVMARLERYHPVTFAFADSRLKDLRLSGTYRCNDLPLFLRTLSAALPVEARWTGSQSVELVPSPPSNGPRSWNHPDTNE